MPVRVVAMMKKNFDIKIIEKQLEVLFEILSVEREIDIKIAYIMEYINENYKKKITNKDVANELNIDVDYLGRLFKGKMGITLHKYIEKFRIQRACIKILQEEKIEMVSRDVGYEDTKAFIRAFKRNIGYTLTEYLYPFLRKIGIVYLCPQEVIVLRAFSYPFLESNVRFEMSSKTMVPLKFNKIHNGLMEKLSICVKSR